MSLSAIIICAAIIVVCLYMYLRRRDQFHADVKNGDKEYQVPLSTDVQHIYYDEYDKEMKRQAAQAEQEKLQAEQDARDEAEFQKNREQSQASKDSDQD